MYQFIIALVLVSGLAFAQSRVRENIKQQDVVESTDQKHKEVKSDPRQNVKKQVKQKAE